MKTQTKPVTGERNAARVEIGKTYMDSRGKKVKIMGFAKSDPIDDQPIYWSLQGDWYASDGRLVWSKPIRGEREELVGFTRGLTQHGALQIP